MEELTPREIVAELDKYIIGQDAAKKAVAIALRNRYRRAKLGDEMKDEIIPKNILMIGTTGIGKTEIARRLAALARAPMIKVEATKFTEVGYVGRDVDAIIRDLTEVGVHMVQTERMAEVEQQARQRAEERLLTILSRQEAPSPEAAPQQRSPFAVGPGGAVPPPAAQSPEDADRERREARRAQRVREFTRRRLEAGELEDELVDIDVEEGITKNVQIFSAMGVEELGFNLQDMLGNILPRQRSNKKAPVREAREILAYEEAQKLIDRDEVQREGVQRVEQHGIVFLDELDKIAGRESGHGPEVSREGVQRDVLPIVEGSTVLTKYGPVKTHHILFIAAGAFHVSKPSDLIPELQGRFPIRVELNDLTEEDFRRILTEPRNSLVKQYRELLATENVEVEFTEDGIAAVAEAAARVNEQAENIGARRLHTVMERVLEDVSFEAPDMKEAKLVVDADFVRERLAEVLEDEDLSRYIL
ncbi:MAG: ATP-dependent protease ATPase subunit HslU [Armatimonadota bacterium]